jgi:hypothetical protein
MKPLLLLCLVFICACSKKEDRSCWQLIDQAGNRLNTVCNKTEAEMRTEYPGNCRYYLTDGEKFCWLINNRDYYENLTQDGINKTVACYYGSGATVVKVGCGYCQQYYHRIKRTYKPSGAFVLSPVTREIFCGDTVNVLFNGRQIVLKDTPDSLVVRQFSSTPNF